MNKEIVLTTKKEYLNTPIHYLNNMYRNGWSVTQEEEIMIFIK